MPLILLATAWLAGIGLAYCLMAINPRDDD